MSSKVQRDKKRKALAFIRAFGSKERAKWITERPCDTCGIHLEPEQHHNSHVKTKATGGRPWHIITQCWRCHGLLGGGIDTFFASIGKSKQWALNLAMEINDEWEARSCATIGQQAAEENCRK